MERIILASASSDRAALLRAAGFEFDVVPPRVPDESLDVEETLDGYVRRLALTRVDAVMAQARGRPVLAAKTIVVVDGRVLGRPSNADEAHQTLKMLSGREHVVTTAICFAYLVEGAPRTRTRVERTTVAFVSLTDAEIDWYVKSGEPIARRGGYAVNGLALRFVTRIDGSYSNVVGLPIAVMHELYTEAGLQMC